MVPAPNPARISSQTPWGRDRGTLNGAKRTSTAQYMHVEAKPVPNLYLVSYRLILSSEREDKSLVLRICRVDIERVRVHESWFMILVWEVAGKQELQEILQLNIVLIPMYHFRHWPAIQTIYSARWEDDTHIWLCTASQLCDGLENIFRSNHTIGSQTRELKGEITLLVLSCRQHHLYRTSFRCRFYR